MGHHLTPEGEFRSDKYPTCPVGKVPLSTKNPAAQPLLWQMRAVVAAYDLDPKNPSIEPKP
jgi:hypothetical protein